MFTPYNIYFEDNDWVALTKTLECQFEISSRRESVEDGSWHTFQNTCLVMVADKLSDVKEWSFMVIEHNTWRSVGSWEVQSIVPKDLQGGFHHSFIKWKKAI